MPKNETRKKGLPEGIKKSQSQELGQRVKAGGNRWVKALPNKKGKKVSGLATGGLLRCRGMGGGS